MTVLTTYFSSVISTLLVQVWHDKTCVVRSNNTTPSKSKCR